MLTIYNRPALDEALAEVARIPGGIIAEKDGDGWAIYDHTDEHIVARFTDPAVLFNFPALQNVIHVRDDDLIYVEHYDSQPQP
jgi:hypothetical protein